MAEVSHPPHDLGPSAPAEKEAPEPLLAFALSSGLVGPAQKVLDNTLRANPELAFDLLHAEARGEGQRLPCVWPNATVRSAAFAAAIRHAEATGGVASVPPPPLSTSGLRSWATAHGVQPFLGQPAAKLLKRWLDHRTEQELRTLPLNLLVESQPSDEPLVRLARTYLWAQALLLKRIGAGAASGRAAGESGSRPLRRGHPLQPVADQVADELEELARIARLGWSRKTRPKHYEMKVGPMGEVLVNWEHGWYTTWTSICIEPGRIGEGRCDCLSALQGRGCHHLFWTYEAIAELLRERLDECPKAVLEVIGTPAWKRRLQRIDAALTLARTTAVDELLSFRLSVTPQSAHLSPFVHQLLKNGRWSAGRRTLADAALRRAFPECERAIAILASQMIGPVVTVHALEALEGYPHVYLENRLDARVAVRRGELRIDLRRADAMGGFQLIASVDGDEELGRQLRLNARHGSDRVLADPKNNLCVLVHLSTAQEALLEALGERCEFPKDSLGELVPRLELLETHARLAFPPELEGELVEADPRLVARLTPGEQASLRMEVRVRPLGESAAVEPGAGPAQFSAFRDGHRVRARRDLDDEIRRAGELVASLGLQPATDASRWTWDLVGDAALDLVAALQARAAEGLIVEWPERKRIETSRGLGPKNLRVKVEDKRDWFGLSGDLELDGAQVSLAVVLEAVRQGRRWVEVGAGRWAEITGELRARLEKAADVVYQGRSGMEVSTAGASALGDFLDDAGELQACARWKAAVDRMKQAQAIEPVLPSSLKAELRGYQLDGFRWLARMAQWGMGACLADDMGLGKTVQALAVLLGRAELGPAMVVAPTSVCFNWLREAERFAPELKPILFREGDRAATLASLGPGNLLVCSYGLLVQHAEELKACRLATLVLDEAQAVKNPATRRARAARDLDADWRLALSGTPLENHVGELWSLFRILNPGLLGSWDQFRERFAGPIERQKDAGRREALARVVRPFVLRRTKAEVARDLPARTEVRRTVSLSAAERRLYDEARMVALATLSGAVESAAGADKRFALLAALTRLRQLACHPRLHDAASKVASSKLRALLELVDELRDNDHRALVFSQFTSHLALVREALDERKVSYLYLDGQTPEAERMRRVDAFQRGEAELFLISLKAGGTGLNLTAADYVIHLDPWWNPAVEDQATDRAHRIGQTRPVTVYRLVAKGTIEEAILGMHDEKRDLVAGVLEGASGAARLSTEELLELIRAGEGETGLETDELADDVDEQPSAPAPIASTPAAPQKPGERSPVGNPGPRAFRASLDGPPAHPDWTLAELVAGFEKHLESEVGKSSVKIYLLTLRKFTAWIDAEEQGEHGTMLVAELDGLLARYCEQKQEYLATSTGKNMRSVLNRLARFAADPGASTKRGR